MLPMLLKGGLIGHEKYSNVLIDSVYGLWVEVYDSMNLITKA